MSELKKMVIGFMLTSILGGFAGAWFQHMFWSNQEKARISSRKQEEAMGLYKEISTLMNKRISRLRVYIQACRDNDDKDYIQKSAEQSQLVLDEWVINNQRNLTLLKWYFGDEAVKAYEKVYVAIDLAETNQLSNQTNAEIVDREIESAWLNLNWFNTAAITRLKNF